MPADTASEKAVPKIQVSRELTCHLRHCGLNEGRPRRAFAASLKTNSWLSARPDGTRCGKSLAGYVVNGNRSKSCLIGAGTLKKDGALPSVCEPSVAGGGIAKLSIVDRSNKDAASASVNLSATPTLPKWD